MFKYIIAIVIGAAVAIFLVFWQILQYRKFSQHPWKDVFSHKGTVIVYVVLRMLVIFTMVRAMIRFDVESALTCVLVMVLFTLPMILEKRLKIEISPIMEVIILLFIFAAEILGELGSFYVRVPGWDTALHTINGFLCAAVGFSIADMLNRSDDVELNLSPFFLAVVAFCFSMTVGVLWEFFEFSMDKFFRMDMQKDYLVRSIHTVNLDETMSNIVVHVNNIVRTTIETAEGNKVVIEGGYLDLGIRDTMKDLMVNCLGAIIFSTIGFFGAKHQKDEKRGRIAKMFIPVVKKPRDILKVKEKSDRELIGEMIDEQKGLFMKPRKLALDKKEKK